MFLLWTLIFLFIFWAFIGLNFAYKNPLYEETQKVVPGLQNKDSFIDYFMNFIGLLEESFGIVLTAFLVANLLPVSESCFFLITIGSCSYINGILKILFHSPRPFFDTPDIQALNWNTSSGNPSGHSMYFTFAIPVLFVVIVKDMIS